jgi:hypothetical protein
LVDRADAGATVERTRIENDIPMVDRSSPPLISTAPPARPSRRCESRFA